MYESMDSKERYKIMAISSQEILKNSMNLQEFCEEFNVSPSVLYMLRSKGKIPYYHADVLGFVGSIVYIPVIEKHKEPIKEILMTNDEDSYLIKSVSFVKNPLDFGLRQVL